MHIHFHNERSTIKYLLFNLNLNVNLNLWQHEATHGAPVALLLKAPEFTAGPGQGQPPRQPHWWSPTKIRAPRRILLRWHEDHPGRGTASVEDPEASVHLTSTSPSSFTNNLQVTFYLPLTPLRSGKYSITTEKLKSHHPHMKNTWLKALLLDWIPTVLALRRATQSRLVLHPLQWRSCLLNCPQYPRLILAYCLENLPVVFL